MPRYEYKDTLLTIDQVDLSLENDSGVHQILRNVSAEIKDIVQPGNIRGQIVGFLGPSGMGKTQLFRVIAGLQKPTAGQVLVNAEKTPVTNGLVGVVAQDYPLFRHHSVMKNLELAAAKGGYSKSDGRAKAMEMLQRFGLEQQVRHFPAQLSGGQRQRVAIIQQLLCSNYFLLMDEPFSGLDPIALKELCNVIVEIASLDEKNTIIVVTHDVPAALTVADTLWLLGRERKRETGELLPGARIVKTINLIDEGLAWTEDIKTKPRFADLVREIEDVEFPILKEGVPVD